LNTKICRLILRFYPLDERVSDLNEAWLCEGGGYTRRWVVAKKQLFGYRFQGLLGERRRAMDARIGE
jgi:hypothetical protein